MELTDLSLAPLNPTPSYLSHLSLCMISKPQSKKARTSKTSTSAETTEKDTNSLTMSSFLRLGQTMPSQSQSQLSQSQNNEICCSQSSNSSTTSAALLSHSRLQNKRSPTIEELIQTQGEEEEEMTQIIRDDDIDVNDSDGVENKNTSKGTRIVEESPIQNAIMELENDDDHDMEDNDQINALFNDGASTTTNAASVTTPMSKSAVASSNEIIEVGAGSSIVSPLGTTAVSIAADADLATSTPSPLRGPTPDNNAPCPRWGQTMTLIEDSKLLVYGGQTLDGDKIKTLTDLHVYDMVKRTWSKPINCEGMPRTWVSLKFDIECGWVNMDCIISAYGPCTGG